MTKEATLARVRDLIGGEGNPENENDIIESTVKEAEKILNSGAVEYASAEDDYRLPKMLVHAALARVADQYLPLTREGRQEARRLANA